MEAAVGWWHRGPPNKSSVGWRSGCAAVGLGMAPHIGQGELEAILWDVQRDIPKAVRGFGHRARLRVPLRAPNPLR